MIGIPYASLDTLFLDAGNTLICMDYGWIAAELKTLGIAASPDSIRRAEAAARPGTSARIERARGGDDYGLFEFHLAGMLERLEPPAAKAPAGWAPLAAELAARLKKPGEDFRLWSWVLPGVPEALHQLKALGLRLVVVSNSDGSVERALRELGLTVYLDAVFDSRVVGFEKPDPRFFRHAMHQSGADPQRTAHVGDMYYQDVQGSRAAGLHGVLIDPFGDWRVADCAVCRDLAELADRLERARLQRTGEDA